MTKNPGMPSESWSRRSLGSEASEQAARTDAKPHRFLRTATRPWHDRVEAAFAPFDLRTVEGLAGFLIRQAAAHLPLEAELDARGMVHLLPDWPERRRSGALMADLDHLGVVAAIEPVRANLPTPGHMFGALYVLEGSRLGGRLLQRQLADSPDALVRSATKYLNHPGAPAGWAGLVAALDAISPTEPQRADLLSGAEQAFSLYYQAALRDH